MRLSTRDLFAVITFAAVIAWCASQVGYDNELFWTSTIISLILGAIVAAYSGTRDARFAIVIVALFLGGFCAMPFGSLATLLVAGLLFFASLVCIAVPVRSYRVRCGIAMTCIAAVFVYAQTFGTEYVRELAKLREQFPIESLEDRLAYEPPVKSAPPMLQVKLSDQLADDEEQLSRTGNRDWQLERIHERRYEQFVRAQGFGVSRMRRPHREDLVRDPIRDIPFTSLESPPTQEAENLYHWRFGNSLAAADPATSLHAVSRFDFLDTEGYGAVLQPRTKVAGFIEHAFHYHPYQFAQKRARWSIDRLELVSLLKFDTPRVYVFDHLPRMDQLSSDTAPTRPLNEFEASALQKLQTDEDLVVAENGKQVEMLGSLRAAKQCLGCHNVQRGELLGAFSYQLTLTESRGAAPPKESQTAP